LNVLKEFKGRSQKGQNDGIDVIFLCNIWEAARIYQSTIEISRDMEELMEEYRSNMQSILIEMLPLFDFKADRLFLQTSHLVTAEYKDLIPFINIEVIKIASEFKLPVFREDLYLGSPSLKNYLRDAMHQNQRSGEFLAEKLKSFLYNNTNN